MLPIGRSSSSRCSAWEKHQCAKSRRADSTSNAQIMPSSRKINLDEVQASLDKVCPKCGRVIPPAEVPGIDFERIECPVCGERFVPAPMNSYPPAASSAYSCGGSIYYCPKQTLPPLTEVLYRSWYKSRS